MDPLHDFVVPDDVAAFCRRSRTVAVPTDDADPALALARHATTQLAAEYDLEVLLYDRSGERWTHTPHPKGPIPEAELGDDRPHLRAQLDDLDRHGIRASAWLATVPALTAMTDILDELAVDAFVLPRRLDRPRLMDRLQVGAGPAEMVERVAALQNDGPTPAVLVVGDDRRISLETRDHISVTEGTMIDGRTT